MEQPGHSSPFSRLGFPASNKPTEVLSSCLEKTFSSEYKGHHLQLLSSMAEGGCLSLWATGDR